MQKPEPLEANSDEAADSGSDADEGDDGEGDGDVVFEGAGRALDDGSERYVSR